MARNLSTPDWQTRIRTGRSLVPDLPLDKIAAQRGTRHTNFRVPVCRFKTRHCDGTGFGLANYLDVPFLPPGGTYPRPQLVPHELGPFLWQVKEAALAGLVGTRLGIPAES